MKIFILEILRLSVFWTHGHLCPMDTFLLFVIMCWYLFSCFCCFIFFKTIFFSFEMSLDNVLNNCSHVVSLYFMIWTPWHVCFITFLFDILLFTWYWKSILIHIIFLFNDKFLQSVLHESYDVTVQLSIVISSLTTFWENNCSDFFIDTF